MQRHHLIEIHEQPWYPTSLRHMTQDALGKMLTVLRFDRPFVQPMVRLLAHTGTPAILDMCSGSAELLVAVCQQAAAHLGRPLPRLWLSDLYPNPSGFQRLRRQLPDAVEFFAEPVDARRAPRGEGVPPVRTLFNGLHHFQPPEVRAILADAAHHADGIGIFEATDRSWLSALATPLMAPVASGVASCCLRPWRPMHALFGSMLPVVPSVLIFDGIISNMRTHHPAELRRMVQDIDAPDFAWEIGSTPLYFKGGPQVNYLLGWRCHRATSTPRAN